MTANRPHSKADRIKIGMSPKGFGYLLLALAIIVGVCWGLATIGEVWSQIVLGLFIAALVVPMLIAILFLIVAWMGEANFEAAMTREAELRAQAMLEARERRARSRPTYIGPDDLPQRRRPEDSRGPEFL